MSTFHAVLTRQVGDLMKQLAQVSASGESPERVLDRLRSFDVDWYVTESGDLFVRYWQLGAEDFIPAERAAVVRSQQVVPPEADRLEWLSANLDALRAEHAGQWLGATGAEVVTAPTLPELMEKVEERGLENPIITQIPAEEPVWLTTYAVQII